ncbi:hypothetical protein NG702_19530 [Pseudarthrobacter sp. MDT3-28]|uniref:hypothetical protein n=1 Tax=Pseudarthrobacter raffinosi TaxID=2953651 RepID=UPI00208E2877|nr:hypothetical protein [Pseudarthrobacter sp. MDT3-28]MCO4239569.1 hypothetical protein [Pseudarthrobacter sp. MDT3-28]
MKTDEPIQLQTRCTARRKSGTECKNWAIRGGYVCRMHGGGAPQVKKKAAQRIAEAADDAAALLVQFMEDPKNDVKVRMQIAQDLLNRAGFVGKQSVDLTVSRFDELVETGGFLVDLGETADDEILAIEELPRSKPSVEVRKRRRSSR